MPKAILKSAYFKSKIHVSNYIQYIYKQSPIFTFEGDVPLNHALEEAERHGKSQFWRQIYSLQEDDCARLAIDRDYFKQFLLTKKNELAKLYNISPENLRVVASFHDKDYHPHLHMVMYSTNHREGHLHVHKDADRNKVLNQASKGLKSLFTNEIFRGDLQEIKEAKSTQRDRLFQQIKQDLQKVTKPEYQYNHKITAAIQRLGQSINSLPGRKSYGYMPPAIKKEIDELLRYILSNDKTAANLFSQYAQSQKALVEIYADHPETITRKMQQWETSFFSPSKGEDATRHNLILSSALQLETFYKKAPATPTKTTSSSTTPEPPSDYEIKIRDQKEQVSPKLFAKSFDASSDTKKEGASQIIEEIYSSKPEMQKISSQQLAEHKLVPNRQYQHKNAGEVTQSLLFNLCKSLAMSSHQNKLRQETSPPARGRRMKKTMHSQNRGNNKYER